MLYIKVPDMNDSMSSISIDGVLYYLRFTYNETADLWSVGIYNKNRSPVVAMTRIVPNFPLFFYYRGEELPDGIWACLSNKEHIGRQTFNDGDAEFCYVPNVEVAGVLAEYE